MAWGSASGAPGAAPSAVTPAQQPAKTTSAAGGLAKLFPQGTPGLPASSTSAAGWGANTSAPYLANMPAMGATGSKPGRDATAAAPTYGSQSGPTAVEDWFNQRASGTDPGWEYATGRAQDQINNQYAARGGYNSSGATQSLSDMYANATSQREGQLDTLANSATIAHQNALNEMFNVGGGIASGQAGTAATYDTASGAAQGQGLQNTLNLGAAKNGVDAANTQSEISLATNAIKAYQGGSGGKSGS